MERLLRVVDFEVFRGELEAALSRSDRSKGGRPPYDMVMMFKVLVLQTLYTLSDSGVMASSLSTLARQAFVAFPTS